MLHIILPAWNQWTYALIDDAFKQNVVLDRPSDMKNGSAKATTTATKCSAMCAATLAYYFLGALKWLVNQGFHFVISDDKYLTFEK